MDLNVHTHPDKLEKYSFLWSEARLLVAAIALFIGGKPPVLLILPIPIVYSLLTIAWIISGLVSGYLLYRWHKNGKKLFGGKDKKDTIAFFVNVVSGFNLGITGLVGTNIGMSISSNYIVFIAAGFLYLVTAYHLWMRYTASNQKIFF